MKLKIRIETKGGDVRELILDGKDSYSLGRANADINLDEPACSRVHALLFSDSSGCLQVRDMGSRNGTNLNGKKIDVAVVSVGSYLKLGATKIYFDEIAINGKAPEVKPSGPASSVLLGWPHAIRSIPKQKLAPFVDYVDDDVKKKSIRLQELVKKRKKSG